MNVKICNECQQEKPLDEFYMDRRFECQRSRCKECARNYNRKWRDANRAYHNARAMKWAKDHPKKQKEIGARNYKKQNKKRDAVKSQIFNEHPCLICGERRPGCLSFHHLNPDEKEHGVTSHSLTWKRMLEEASKCVILCLNCHCLYHQGEVQLPSDLNPIDVIKYQASFPQDERVST
jgi:hypothetical protein